MTKREDDNANGKHGKSYRRTLLEQNIWRCDCSDEGEHYQIDRHQNDCKYAFWFVLNDLHLAEPEEDNGELGGTSSL